MYNDQPMFRQNGSKALSITGSARSFGTSQKIINVANLKFELIAEHVKPRFELIQTGPTATKEGIAEAQARYSVEGEVDLYNFLFDSGFE